MKLFRTRYGPAIEQDGMTLALPDDDWDALFNSPDLHASLQDRLRLGGASLGGPSQDDLLPPIGNQEVWAAGVTYFRSRDARMEESKAAGGDDFYARVYEAERPELFFKATPHRVAGHGQPVRMRSDARWTVPEPELALAVNSAGQIVGYTIGNDMSSRDIEGENPLYLPQAKVYDGSCALGPAVLVTPESLPVATTIKMQIDRRGKPVYTGETDLSQLRRAPGDLVGFLMRDNSFPKGCFLLTGTGIVPPTTFALEIGDVIRITIPPIGTLTNAVVSAPR